MSWTTAFADLQSALAAASSGTTIRVAAGTYKPTSGTDPNVSFRLAAGVTIVGGYPASGGDTRDPAANETILSGNLGTTENSYHVVRADGVDGSAVIDGFTIRDGSATGGSRGFTYAGGGMLTMGASPTVRNVIFRNNAAKQWGGGLYTDVGYSLINAGPTLEHVTFDGNTAVQSGGGAYITTSTTLTDVTFTGNRVAPDARFPYTATDGGGGLGIGSRDAIVTCARVTWSGNSTTANGAGMWVRDSAPALSDAAFAGNTASGSGGGLYLEGADVKLTGATFSSNTSGDRGGAVYANVSSLVATNVTVTGNTATDGGGIYLSVSGDRDAESTLTYVTVSGNTATAVGGGLHYEDDGYETAPLAIRNSILWGNGANGGLAGDFKLAPDIRDTVVEGGLSEAIALLNLGTNVIAADPRLGTLGSYGGHTQTIPLILGSSAIDAGSTFDGKGNAYGVTTDQRGVSRPQGATVDVGAYEYDGPRDTTAPVVTVPGAMTADASGPRGAVVTFAASANDDTDGPITPTCVPASGDMFPVGTTTVTCSATDTAANTGSAQFSVTVRDTTPPEIGVLRDGTLGNQGWYTTDVRVSWSVQDSESAITATTGCAVATFTADTKPVSLMCSATSGGGTNSATVTIQRDATGPVITWADGASTCTADDATSGLDANGCTVSGYGDSTPGTHTATATATDVAGNRSMMTRTYSVVAPRDIYVDLSATAGARTGASWADAFTDLQSAIAVAQGGATIRVAEGTYRPTATTIAGNPRSATFQLNPNVTWLGGFPSGGGDDSSRHPGLHRTTLSGDIGVAGDKTDNAYHVVKATLSGYDANGTYRNYPAAVDGFTITGGNANDRSGENAVPTGGGLQIVGGTPTLTNLTVSGNDAEDYGGGMFLAAAGPKVTNSTFSNNTSSKGGGVFSKGGPAEYTNVTFVANTADSGGGINFDDGACGTVTHATFSGNAATTSAAAINVDGEDSGACVFVRNSIVWDAASQTTREDPYAGNVVIGEFLAYKRSSLPVSASVVLGGCSADPRLECTDVITADPNLGPLADNGGYTQTVALLAGSSATDAGADYGVTTDQRGVARPQGAGIDIGAYEYVRPADTTPPVVTVPANMTVEATGANGAVVTFTASATDNVDGALTPACSPASGSLFPVGTTAVTCTARDAAGNIGNAGFTVSVQPYRSPLTIVSLTPNPALLWPANHKLVNVTVAARTSGGTAVTCRIAGATSSEPDNGLGDGDTPGDIGARDGLRIALRAERSGNGSGRTYTIAVTCADAAGGSARSTTTVVVPHDKGK